MAAVLLAVYWLAVRLRYGMKYNDELDIDGTLYVDLGGAEHWQRKLAAPASCDDNVRFTVFLSFCLKYLQPSR